MNAVKKSEPGFPTAVSPAQASVFRWWELLLPILLMVVAFMMSWRGA